MWAYKRQVKINPINCKISITVNYITTRKEKCQSLISKKSNENVNKEQETALATG